MSDDYDRDRDRRRDGRRSYSRDRRDERRDDRDRDRERRGGGYRDEGYRGTNSRRRDDSRSRRDYRDDDRRRRDDDPRVEKDRDHTRKRGRDDDRGDDRREPIPPANIPGDVLASDVLGGAAWTAPAMPLPLPPPTAEEEEDDPEWERAWKARQIGAQIGLGLAAKSEDTPGDEGEESQKKKRSKWDEGSKSGGGSADLPDWLQDLASPSSGPPAGVPAMPPGVGGIRYKQLRLPAKQKGGLIGKGGENINWIRRTSGADIKLKYTPGDEFCYLQITGNVEYVEELIRQKLEESSKDWMTKILDDIPQDLVSQTIGSGGKHLKDIGSNTGCKLDFMNSSELDPTKPCMKVCRIRGPPAQVTVAEQLLRLKVVEVQRLERLKRQGKLTGNHKDRNSTGRLNIPTYRDVMDSAQREGKLDENAVKTGFEMVTGKGEGKGAEDGAPWTGGPPPPQPPPVVHSIEDGPADNIYEGYGAEELLGSAPLPPPPPPAQIAPHAEASTSQPSHQWNDQSQHWDSSWEGSGGTWTKIDQETAANWTDSAMPQQQWSDGHQQAHWNDGSVGSRPPQQFHSSAGSMPPQQFHNSVGSVPPQQFHDSVGSQQSQQWGNSNTGYHPSQQWNDNWTGGGCGGEGGGGGGYGCGGGMSGCGAPPPSSGPTIKIGNITIGPGAGAWDNGGCGGGGCDGGGGAGDGQWNRSGGCGPSGCDSGGKGGGFWGGGNWSDDGGFKGKGKGKSKGNGSFVLENGVYVWRAYPGG